MKPHGDTAGIWVHGKFGVSIVPWLFLLEMPRFLEIHDVLEKAVNKLGMIGKQHIDRFTQHDDDFRLAVESAYVFDSVAGEYIGRGSLSYGEVLVACFRKQSEVIVSVLDELNSWKIVCKI